MGDVRAAQIKSITIDTGTGTDGEQSTDLPSGGLVEHQIINETPLRALKMPLSEF